MLDAKEHIDVLEDLNILLAEFYKKPTTDFYQEIINGTIENQLKELFQLVGFKYPDVSIKNRFDDFSKMEESYMHCFLGVSKPFAPPIESVYKVWTTDPSVEMAIANEKGYLYGDSALHIKHLYEHFQLEIPKEFNSMPDHLTLLLEFLSFVIKNRSLDEVNQLLVDHFDWLNDFKKGLKKAKYSSFYVDVTGIVIQAINEEQKWFTHKLTIS